MCERFPEDVLLDYSQDRLPAVSAAEIERHLPECAACRAALRDIRALTSLHAAAEEPSRLAEERIVQMIARVTRKWNTNRAWPRLARRWAIAAGIALVIGASWAWWGGCFTPSAPAEPVIATLTTVQAEVILRRNGVEQVARAGMVLHPRDTLTVPAGGAAVVDFPDASRAELGPQTTVALAERSATRADDPMLFLHEGFLAVNVGPPVDGKPMRIGTPDARAAVTGTKFTLGAGEHRTNLRVAEGAVNLTRISDGVSVDVPAGYHSTVAANVDPKPVPSRGGTVLQIVSRDKRFPDWDRFNQLISDRLVSTRLWRLGFRVEVRHYRDLQPADLDGRALVIASLFDYGIGAEEALRRVGLAEAAVPVICLEPAAYPALGMSGPKEKTDFGFLEGKGKICLASPEHPLAGGLSGEKDDLFRKCVGWGKPAGNAVTVAHLPGHTDRAVIFAYETGTKMMDHDSPARRVGLFLDPWALDENSATAWALVDAAVAWCVEPPR